MRQMFTSIDILVKDLSEHASCKLTWYISSVGQCFGEVGCGITRLLLYGQLVSDVVTFCGITRLLLCGQLVSGSNLVDLWDYWTSLSRYDLYKRSIWIWLHIFKLDRKLIYIRFCFWYERHYGGHQETSLYSVRVIHNDVSTRNGIWSIVSSSRWHGT